MALHNGTTLESELWRAVRGVIDRAAEGDVKAFETLAKWLVRFDQDGAEPVAGQGGVNLNVGVAVQAGGPQMPEAMEEHYAELERIEQEHGQRRITVEPTKPVGVKDLL